jgi:hypothetical protein
MKTQMPVHSASKITQISQSENPREAIIDAVGSLDGQVVFSDLVLVGTYIRNEKTSGGIIRPTDVMKEDEYQSKVGLVLKTGPLAYSDWEGEGDQIRGQNAQLHTWVVFAIKDTWPVQINGTPCRFVPYDKLRMRLTDPTLVF